MASLLIISKADNCYLRNAVARFLRASLRTHTCATENARFDPQRAGPDENLILSSDTDRFYLYVGVFDNNTQQKQKHKKSRNSSRFLLPRERMQRKQEEQTFTIQGKIGFCHFEVAAGETRKLILGGK